jgi:hypothetical protein
MTKIGPHLNVGALEVRYKTASDPSPRVISTRSGCWRWDAQLMRSPSFYRSRRAGLRRWSSVTTKAGQNGLAISAPTTGPNRRSSHRRLWTRSSCGSRRRLSMADFGADRKSRGGWRNSTLLNLSTISADLMRLSPSVTRYKSLARAIQNRRAKPSAQSSKKT